MGNRKIAVRLLRATKRAAREARSWRQQIMLAARQHGDDPGYQAGMRDGYQQGLQDGMLKHLNPPNQGIGI